MANDARAAYEQMSLIVKSLYETNPEFPVSTLTALRDFVTVRGNTFIIICSLPDGSTYLSLHTRKELGFDRIPTGHFHKPDPFLNLYVLTRDKRDFPTLAGKGWL